MSYLFKKLTDEVAQFFDNFKMQNIVFATVKYFCVVHSSPVSGLHRHFYFQFVFLLCFQFCDFWPRLLKRIEMFPKSDFEVGEFYKSEFSFLWQLVAKEN